MTELEKEQPDLSYIRGMVEVLLETDDKYTMPSPQTPMVIPTGVPVTQGDIRKEIESFKKPEGALGPADPYNSTSSFADALRNKK